MDAGIPQTNKIQNKGLELPTRGSRRLITPCLTSRGVPCGRVSGFGFNFWVDFFAWWCSEGSPKDLHLSFSSCDPWPYIFSPSQCHHAHWPRSKADLPPKTASWCDRAGASGPIGAPAWMRETRNPFWNVTVPTCSTTNPVTGTEPGASRPTSREHADGFPNKPGVKQLGYLGHVTQ